MTKLTQQQNIDALKHDIGMLQERLQTKTTEITNLNSRYVKANDEINTLRNRLYHSEMINARMSGRLEEIENRERKEAKAARPPIMVPLDQHPRERDRQMQDIMDSMGYTDSGKDSSKSWYSKD